MTCKATGHVHVTVYPGETFCQACGEFFEPDDADLRIAGPLSIEEER